MVAGYLTPDNFQALTSLHLCMVVVTKYYIAGNESGYAIQWLMNYSKTCL